MHDIHLSFRKRRSIGTHVVKQYGEFINPDEIKQLKLRGKRGTGSIIETVKDLKRAQPDTKPQTLLMAKPTELRQLRCHRGRVRLLPAAAQEGIGLRRIEIKAITVRRQCAHQLPSLLPVPYRPVEALDNPQRCAHGCLPVQQGGTRRSGRCITTWYTCGKRMVSLLHIADCQSRLL